MQIDDSIRSVCSEIILQFSPDKVILFSIKHSVSGKTRSFKVCVIMRTDEKAGMEKRIYLDVDSDIPFDVLLYTPEEWEKLISQKDSFARSITEEGTVIYEAGKAQDGE